MLFACAFLFQFLCAGLTGIILSVVPFTGSSPTPTSWWRTFTSCWWQPDLHDLRRDLLLVPQGDRPPAERAVRSLALLALRIGFNLTFLPMHWAGMLGMPRRIYTYPADRGGFWNLLASFGVPFQAAAVLIFLVNVAISLRRGERAGSDPWDAWTLEWATASPPPPYNFETAPVVASRRPLWDLKHPDDPDGPHE